MSWKSILKMSREQAETMFEALLTEEKVMRPKQQHDHPLQQKVKQLYDDLDERLTRELGPKPKEDKTYIHDSPYRKWVKAHRDSPEQEEIFAINRKINFEYTHGVGFFQGQEPKDIKPFHGFDQPTFDEEFYRERGYEPPKNKKHMKR